MKILSIDVGIKNLAYCLMETLSDTETKETKDNKSLQKIVKNTDTSIIQWDVINLCGEIPKCSIDKCNKPSKYVNQTNQDNIEYLCLTHSKKSGLIIPSANLSLKKLKKMKLVDLNKIVSEYSIIPSNESSKMKKEDVYKTIIEYMEKHMLSAVSTISANDFDLVNLGIAMKNAFDKELDNHIKTIDCIIIENQISPIANRMKTLQGMIAQYFIMNNKTKIDFISAANKLKGHVDLFETDISTYNARKKESINVMNTILNEMSDTDKYNEKWINHFKNHKKKDDLADAYLQGNWYLKHKKCMGV